MRYRSDLQRRDRYLRRLIMGSRHMWLVGWMCVAETSHRHESSEQVPSRVINLGRCTQLATSIASKTQWIYCTYSKALARKEDA